MNRDSLTALYLDEVKRRGAAASELIGTGLQSDGRDIYYGQRYLSRPLFLGADERDQLYTDLDNMRSALISLPDRLFGGDLAEFARAVGMNEVQVSAILRSRRPEVTRQTRADLYVDETGFRLLEFNMGSALGGMDNADIARALLVNPLLGEFAATHNLEFSDTMRDQVYNIHVENGFEPGSRPMMAMTDWPSSYTSLEPYMRYYCGRLSELGLDAHACNIGELEVRDGGVWLGDRKVDIIDRLFMIEDLLENPEAAALMDPILDAAARGEVMIHTPLDSGLYASKGALAMLSDEQNRPLFPAHELESLDRILPWTRMVRPGPVTLEDGNQVDLVEYALTHQNELALKPTALHGGQGVLLGWRAETSPQAWEEAVNAALNLPYVIQRRIRPVPEFFPGEDGEPVPWIVAWGVFTAVAGYSGVWSRAFTLESNVELITLGGGAFVGTCLHER